MSSINSNSAVIFSADGLKAFAKERYGSLSRLAREMGISPQHLHGYINGQRAWGAAFIQRLAQVGFKTTADENESCVVNNGEPPTAESCSPNPIGAIPDLHGACRLLACSPEELAQRIGASRKIVPAWEAGEARPSYDQLVMLYHQVLAIAVHCCEAERRPAATAAAPDVRQAAAG